MCVYLCPKPCSHSFIINNTIPCISCNDVYIDRFMQLKDQWKNTNYIWLNENEFVKYRSFIAENYYKIVTVR